MPSTTRPVRDLRAAAELGDEPRFELEEIVRAKQALRRAAGVPPEAFDTWAFVSIVSDELDALLDAGRSDADICALVTAVIGRPFDAAALAEIHHPARALERRAARRGCVVLS